MADNNRPIGGTFEDVGEALEPVKDEVGKAIEAGIQSVMGKTQTTPKTPADKINPQNQDNQNTYKLEEQKKLSEARRKIKWWKDLEATQKRVREEEKQKELQKQQEEERKKQEKTQVKQFEVSQKQKQLHPETAAKGKAEIKRGIGG